MHARMTAGLALALALVMSAPPVRAQDEQAGAEATQRRLEEAQRRLEEAAREVAGLAVELGGPAMRQIRKFQFGGAGRAVLGVNIDNAAPGTDGVRVVSVSPGGPAAEAGVVADDLIVAVNGKKVAAGRELIDRMREVKAGDNVALDLRRGGKAVAATVVARAAEDVAWDVEFEGPGMPGMPGMHGMPGVPGHPGMPMGEHFLLGPWSDAELVAMTPALGRYFGTDKGLLVVRSPKVVGADLEEGDVILSIGGREPQSGGHALRILRSYQPGENVDLKVLRQRKERTVRIVVPEGPEHPDRHAIIRKEVNKAPAPPAPPAPPKSGG